MGGMQDHAFILSEKCFGGCPQNLRVGKVYKADDGCTEQVNKKDHFIGAVVMNEFFECMHKKFLSSYDFYLVSHDVDFIIKEYGHYDKLFIQVIYRPLFLWYSDNLD